MSATDLFLSLTPEKVLDAVDASGLHCNPVCYALNSFENRVYDIELEDRSHVVAKFYRPERWTEAQILEEHQYLADLVLSEVPVCAMRPFPDGTTLKKIDHIYYCVADRRGGRAPEELSDEQVERLGMLAARLHNVGAGRDAPHRLRLNADNYIRQHLTWFAAHGTIPKHLEARYIGAASAIADIVDARMEGVATHRIHGDFHLGNLLYRDGRINALDFDDMAVGPAVQDLWLLLPGRDAVTRRHHEVFLEAYEQLRAFDRTTLSLIEPLRGLRYIHYAAWLARRWHDPAFPATWPHFGTEAYWEQETADLEDQLRICRGGEDRYQSAPSDDEGALEPKDYFWDMDDTSK